MTAIEDLETLLRTLSPRLRDGDYVFCSVDGGLVEHADLDPLASFREEEGLSLILERSVAETAGFTFDGVFRLLTLEVRSSLLAIGLTAAITKCLTEHGISANVIAATHHDHILVPAAQADRALAALQALSALASNPD